MQHKNLLTRHALRVNQRRSSGAGVEAEEALRARLRFAWTNFSEMAPMLTSRRASLKVKVKVYRAFIP